MIVPENGAIAPVAFTLFLKSLERKLPNFDALLLTERDETP